MDATDIEPGEAQYYGCCVVDLYNQHRPHRSLDLTPPNGPPANDDRAHPDNLLVVQRVRLGGLVHEYEGAA